MIRRFWSFLCGRRVGEERFTFGPGNAVPLKDLIYWARSSHPIHIYARREQWNGWGWVFLESAMRPIEEWRDFAARHPGQYPELWPFR